jgi:hypothetical protein
MKIATILLLGVLALLGCSESVPEVRDACVIKADGKVILCYEAAEAVDSASCRSSRIRATNEIDFYATLDIGISRPDIVASSVETECPSGRAGDCPMNLTDITRTIQYYDSSLVALCATVESVQ